MKDLVDRHISRATETEDLHQRYLQLLRAFGSTVFRISLVFLAACGVLAGGITAAVVYAGVPLEEVLGFAGGGTAVTLAAVSTIWRFRRVDKLSRGDQAEGTDAAADEDAA